MSVAFCYKTLRKGHGQIHTAKPHLKTSFMFFSKTINSNGEKAVTGKYKHSSMHYSFLQGLQKQPITITSTCGKRHICKFNRAVGHLS